MAACRFIVATPQNSRQTRCMYTRFVQCQGPGRSRGRARGPSFPTRRLRAPPHPPPPRPLPRTRTSTARPRRASPAPALAPMAWTGTAPKRKGLRRGRWRQVCKARATLPARRRSLRQRRPWPAAVVGGRAAAGTAALSASRALLLPREVKWRRKTSGGEGDWFGLVGLFGRGNVGNGISLLWAGSDVSWAS